MEHTNGYLSPVGVFNLSEESEGYTPVPYDEYLDYDEGEEEEDDEEYEDVERN